MRDPRRETVTDSAGRFRLEGLPAGAVEIDVTTVGYGLARESVIAGGADVEIRLPQAALRRSEEVAVTTSAFKPVDRAAPGAYVLAGTELKNLANVPVDDPLHSVQALPGVAASDEFQATFAVRGAGFDNVGFYVDGVVLGWALPHHPRRQLVDDPDPGVCRSVRELPVTPVASSEPPYELLRLPPSVPARITDPIGITSQFGYATGNSIRELTSPYVTSPLLLRIRVSGGAALC